MNVKVIPSIFRSLTFIRIGSAGGIKVLKRTITVAGGVPGSGAGKGGGAGGAIREGGGTFGRLGAAQEDMYFYDKQKQQLQKIKEKIPKEQEEKETVENRRSIRNDLND